MTEPETALTTYTPPTRDVEVIDGCAKQVAQVAQYADYICQTDFVPASYRGNAAAVSAAILFGREMGIGPMQALQDIFVIKGTPAVRAQLMRALVFRAGHTIRVVESSSTRCVLAGARRGGPEQSVTWTLDDAKRAGIAGKQSWAQYPRQMLLARATGELCRAIFPDVIAGMAYTFEEAEDIDRPEIPPAAQPTRVIRRAARTVRSGKLGGDLPEDLMTPAPAEEPPAAPPVQAPMPHTQEATDTRLLSAEQRAKIMADLSRWGRMEPRSLRIRTLAGLVRRPILSTSQLTRAEASQVIDTLTNLEATNEPDEALSNLVIAGWAHIDQATLPIQTTEPGSDA